MKTLNTVYTSDGHYLGDEYVDLSTLQQDTKLAIIQIIYLDKTVDVMNEEINKAVDTQQYKQPPHAN